MVQHHACMHARTSNKCPDSEGTTEPSRTLHTQRHGNCLHSELVLHIGQQAAQVHPGVVGGTNDCAVRINSSEDDTVAGDPWVAQGEGPLPAAQCPGIACDVDGGVRWFTRSPCRGWGWGEPCDQVNRLMLNLDSRFEWLMAQLVTS